MKCMRLLLIAVVFLASSLAFAEGIETQVIGELAQDYTYWGRVDDAFGLDQKDDTEFRRARLGVKGKVKGKVKDIKFLMILDFAGGKIAFKNTYLEVTDVPFVRNVRIGFYPEPLGLVGGSAPKNISFAEYPSATALGTSMGAGVMFFDLEDRRRGSWMLGVFQEGRSDGSSGDGFAVTSRMFSPIAGEEGTAFYLHGGASVSFRSYNEGVRYKASPEFHLAVSDSGLVDTGLLDSDDVTLFALEGVGVFGPTHVSSEWIKASVKGTGDFDGWYVQGGFFLTGEHFPLKDGAIGGVTPKRNFPGGPGAIEVLARYSDLDLNAAGEMSNIALGVNWYLNSWMRFTLNHVMASVDANDEEVGSVSATTVRMQVHF